MEAFVLNSDCSELFDKNMIQTCARMSSSDLYFLLYPGKNNLCYQAFYQAEIQATAKVEYI